MRYHQLGNTGVKVSEFSLGCWPFAGGKVWGQQDPGDSIATTHAALDAGITTFDTAEGYNDDHHSEEVLGRALKGRRNQAVIATKVSGGRLAAGEVEKACEASLRRLGTDWIDLYQLHFPDFVTPIEETLAALSELVAEGKVRYIGSSNFSGWRVVDADWVARSSGHVRFISAQNKYSLYDRAAEAELVPACERVGVGILPYFPLEHGLLTGKYRRDAPAPAGTRLADRTGPLDNADFDRIEALERYAADRGVTILDVAIGGLAAKPAVGSVIAGATKPEQVVANSAAGAWRPAPGDELP